MSSFVEFDNSQRCGCEFREPLVTDFKHFIALLIVLQFVVSILEEMEELVLAGSSVNEVNAIVVVRDRIVLAVDYQNRYGIVRSELLHLLDVNEDGPTHFYAQEGNHQSVGEDGLHVLVALGQGRRINHRVYHKVFHFLAEKLYELTFDPR